MQHFVVFADGLEASHFVASEPLGEKIMANSLEVGECPTSQVSTFIYNEYSTRLARIAIRRASLPDCDLQDVLSTVFERFLRSLHEDTRWHGISCTSFEQGWRERVEGWLITTLSFVLCEHLRERKRYPKHLCVELIDPIPPTEEQENRWATVEPLLNELAPQQRAVLLGVLEGQTDPEMALLMNIGEGTVRTHRFRGIAGLRRRLGVEVR